MPISARPFWWWTLLAVAFTSWLVLLLCDLLQHAGVPQFSSPLFDVDTDRGAAECVGYVLLLVGAVSLLLTWRGSRRRTVHCVLAVFLLTLLVDDMFEMHEYVGALVGERAGLRPIAGIGPPTLGSWAMWGMIIGPFILAFILTWEHSRPRVRRDALGVLRWLIVLLVFAVGVDALRPITGRYGLGWPDSVAYVLKLVEFTGEFVAFVGICVVSLRLALEARTTRRSSVRAHHAGEGALRRPRSGGGRSGGGRSGSGRAGTGRVGSGRTGSSRTSLRRADDHHTVAAWPTDAAWQAGQAGQGTFLPEYDRSFQAQTSDGYGTTTGSSSGTRRRRRPVTMPTDSPSR